MAINSTIARKRDIGVVDGIAYVELNYPPSLVDPYSWLIEIGVTPRSAVLG
jgi:hypothetical protein